MGMLFGCKHSPFAAFPNPLRESRDVERLTEESCHLIMSTLDTHTLLGQVRKELSENNKKGACENKKHIMLNLT